MKTEYIPASEGQRLNVIGDQQRVLLSGAQTGGDYALIEQNPPPGSGVPMHIHDREDETFYILDGAIEFSTEGRTFTGTKGDTIQLPRGIAHTWRVVSETPAKTVLLVRPAGIEGMFQELHALPPGPPDMGLVVGICEKFGVRFVQA